MNHHNNNHRHADPKEERVAKRERLRLLCAADRTRLRLLWRLPARLAKHEHEHDGHHNHAWMGALAGPALTALLPFVPGKIGRWGRHLRTGMGFFRAVTRAAF